MSNIFRFFSLNDVSASDAGVGFRQKYNQNNQQNNKKRQLLANSKINIF